MFNILGSVVRFFHDDGEVAEAGLPYARCSKQTAAFDYAWRKPLFQSDCPLHFVHQMQATNPRTSRSTAYAVQCGSLLGLTKVAKSHPLVRAGY